MVDEMVKKFKKKFSYFFKLLPFEYFAISLYHTLQF